LLETSAFGDLQRFYPPPLTASGTNPCGAAYIDYGDGTAITYAITGLPTTQTHA
jgi:hypothetical protein